MKVTRENLRMLLVDDDENDAELLRIDLEQAGFRQPLTHFRNGSIALEYFKYTKATGSSAPHLILLDLNMPLIDGIRALRRLREVSSFRNLPVIILTGAEDKAKRIEVAKLGIFRFLAKRLHNANVIAALDDFIGFYNREDDPPATGRNIPFAIRENTGPGLSRNARIHLF
jgi:CheY-like chemotaxis protein